MPEAHPGMMVTPSVRLLRPLGEGGMGTVWVAEHLALRTEVVVKFISNALKKDKEALERFSREAAAAAQVKSPHVVQTFDHGITDDGHPWIVMELLEGRDLGAHLDHVGACPPALVLSVVAQLARALDRAHARGIIHRDIKPGNIFLCDGGRPGEVFVKLLDFGIAKGVQVPAIDSATKTGSMVGSPFYMSPEQILGSKDIDHRSDLWSVGVVTFEALTGRKAFDAETMGGLAIRIHSEPLPRPSSFAASLPPAFDAWFAKACARPVHERFSSAEEMANALAAAFGAAAPASGPVVSFAPPDGTRSEHAPTLLAAGATTEGGLERPAPAPSKRNRILALALSLLVLPIASYAIARAVRPKAGPTNVTSAVQPLPKEPDPPRAPSAEPRVTPIETAAASSAPAPVKPPEPAASAHAHPARPGGHPAAPTKTAAPPPPTRSAAVPPPPPASSSAGHDIF